MAPTEAVNENAKRKPGRAWLGYLLVAVATLGTASFAVGCYVGQFGDSLSASQTRWGEFGDYLGGVLSPIFALIGLFVLLRTVSLQTRELELSTAELQKSASALREQSDSLRRQNFERTFFEMVRLQHDIIRDLDLGETTRGRDCFRIFFEKRLRDAYDGPGRQEPEPKKRIETAYSIFKLASEHEVGHYFRNFYRILKFVNESDMENKKEYAGILRAQMSSYELLLTFYSTLHTVGAKLKPLVERYGMFDNLNLNRLFDDESEVCLYARSAYGSQDVSAYYPPS